MTDGKYWYYYFETKSDSDRVVASINRNGGLHVVAVASGVSSPMGSYLVVVSGPLPESKDYFEVHRSPSEY